MKKMLVLCLGLLMSCSLVMAQSLENEPKPEISSAGSEKMKAIETAYALAEYGYANESASALIEAAEILSAVDMQALKAEIKKEGATAETEKSSGHDYTAAQLIDDGIKLAGKNKSLLAWAKEVKKSIKPATRGAASGPQWDIDSAIRNGGTVHYTIPFVGGRFAEIAIYSLDGCDYDLFVYDENGNLVDQDTSYSSSAYCSFNPRWTGPFVVVVKNRSGYTGRYKLVTN